MSLVSRGEAIFSRLSVTSLVTDPPSRPSPASIQNKSGPTKLF